MKWFILILFILTVNTNTNKGQPKPLEYHRNPQTLKTIAEPLDSLAAKLNRLSIELENTL